MTEKRSLAAKLVEVMKAVESVPKNGWNDFHKYEYATEADILRAVRGKLAELGVLMLTSVRGRARRATSPKSLPSTASSTPKPERSVRLNGTVRASIRETRARTKRKRERSNTRCSRRSSSPPVTIRKRRMDNPRRRPRLGRKTARSRLSFLPLRTPRSPLRSNKSRSRRWRRN